MANADDRPGTGSGSSQTEPPRFRLPPIFLVLLLLGLLAINPLFSRDEPGRTIPYSAFLEQLRDGQIQRVQVKSQELEALLASDAEGEEQWVTTERLPGIDETALLAELEAQGVEFSGTVEETSYFIPILLSWMLPIALILGIYYFIFRRLSRGMNAKGNPMSFGKNRAKVYDESRSVKVTFQDVAGIDEAIDEMREVVDFLKAPGKYKAIGAKIPKGVLLVGPPGTGKTLLARAVAGEAAVPFFNLSGSDFVEMFVGVGAARVRDLFEQATQRSPCIIFIDEIDAIGKSRGGLTAAGTHEEREQTLNQLLSEMDGFDAKIGVVIIAATNRPEVLDQALVRAGRFDRQVVVDRPSLPGRAQILRVHAREVKQAPDVDLSVVARRTPGMVGADLAKTVNEAALAAARRGSLLVAQRDFEEAIDRIQLGLKQRGRAMTKEEQRRVAYHESGHALVAMSVENADPVHRVTIIPRSVGALGATLQLPTEDRYLMLRHELLDRICVMLGGRAAEELAFHDVSTGAQNDLERATETARQMVCRFGMSEKLGAQTFGRPMGARFLDSPVNLGEERNFSDETARAIDAEVRHILDTEHRRALEILRAREAVLRVMALRLVEVETLDGPELGAILAAHGPPALPTPPEATNGDGRRGASTVADHAGR